MTRWLLILLALCLLAVPVLAQDEAVTDDEVNEIASKMYCPVCENIPLDTCGTAACQDWRNEIRLYLEQGMNEAEIISDFVARFGDRVVGTPRHPILRAMTLGVPWLLVIAALGIAAYFLRKWQLDKPPADIHTGADDNDIYRDMLEQDLAG